jgi:hypothetical protein
MRRDIQSHYSRRGSGPLTVVSGAADKIRATWLFLLELQR